MTERPIRCYPHEVRAILAGSMTQFRRVVKPQFPYEALPVEMPATDPIGGWVINGHSGVWWREEAANPDEAIRCPYGQPGTKLWVREKWEPDPPIDDSWASTQWSGCGRAIAEVPERFQHPRFCNYAADWLHGPITWRPSIHMPRWASRITLEVTGVRVERLQDISADDCIAEGIRSTLREHDAVCDLRDQYRTLWDSINGPGSWDANPWVWVVEFKRLQQGE